MSRPTPPGGLTGPNLPSGELWAVSASGDQELALVSGGEIPEVPAAGGLEECPGAVELNAMLTEQLAQPRLLAVMLHVEECAACQGALALLTDEGPTRAWPTGARSTDAQTLHGSATPAQNRGSATPLAWPLTSQAMSPAPSGQTPSRESRGSQRGSSARLARWSRPPRSQAPPTATTPPGQAGPSGVADGVSPSDAPDQPPDRELEYLEKLGRQMPSLPRGVGAGFGSTIRRRLSDLLRPAGYDILGELGRGGMGIVFKARQIRLDRLVALKMILAGAEAGHEDRQRFRREAEAVARLTHPNIVQVYEAGEQEGRLWLAMEFVPGGSLADKLRAGPMPHKSAARLVATLAVATEAAHRCGIIHRDLKPANVLLTVEGVPKITDFGLAKRTDRPGDTTHSMPILGTPGYMAPEQIGPSAGGPQPSADVYSLGAILYETLTGRPPFRAATPLETLLMTQQCDPVAPGRLVPGLPRDVETICLKCLAGDPSRRYATAGELAEDLQSFLSGHAIKARPVSGLEQLLKWCRRRPTDAALWSVLLLLLMIGWATASWQWVRAERSADEEKAARQRGDQARARAEEDRGSTRIALAQAESQVLAANRIVSSEQQRRGQARQAAYQAHVAAGLGLWELGRLAEAQGHLRAALANAPGDGTAAPQPPWECALLARRCRLAPPRWPLTWPSTRDRPPQRETNTSSRGSHDTPPYGEAITALSVSPDGRRLLVTAAGGRVSLWDVPAHSGVPAQLIWHESLTPPVKAHFDADGRGVLVAESHGQSGAWSTRLLRYQPATKAKPQTLWSGAIGQRQTLAVGSAGAVALGGTAGVVVIKATGPAQTLQTQAVRALAFAPDGSALATQAPNGEITVYALGGEGPPSATVTLREPVGAFAWLADSQAIVAASTGRAGSLRVFHTADGSAQTQRWRGAIGEAVGDLESLAVSPDGLWAFGVVPPNSTATGGRPVVMTWLDDIAARRLAREGLALTEVTAMACAPDSLALWIAHSDGSVSRLALWATDEAPDSVSHSTPNTAVALAATPQAPGWCWVDAQGHYWTGERQPRAVGGNREPQRLHQLARPGDVLPESAKPSAVWRPPVAISAAGSRVAGVARGRPQTALVWGVPRPSPTAALDISPAVVLEGHAAALTAITFDGPARRLATASGGGPTPQATVIVWSLPDNGRPLVEIPHAGPAVERMTFDPDGQRLLVVGGSRATLYSLADGHATANLAGLTDSETLGAAAFTNNGHWLAAVTATAGPGPLRLRLWSTKDGRAVAEFALHGWSAATVTVQPNDNRLVIVGEYLGQWAAWPWVAETLDPLTIIPPDPRDQPPVGQSRGESALAAGHANGRGEHGIGPLAIAAAWADDQTTLMAWADGAIPTPAVWRADTPPASAMASGGNPTAHVTIAATLAGLADPQVSRAVAWHTSAAVAAVKADPLTAWATAGTRLLTLWPHIAADLTTAVAAESPDTLARNAQRARWAMAVLVVAAHRGDRVAARAVQSLAVAVADRFALSGDPARWALIDADLWLTAAELWACAPDFAGLPPQRVLAATEAAAQRVLRDGEGAATAGAVGRAWRVLGAVRVEAGQLDAADTALQAAAAQRDSQHDHTDELLDLWRARLAQSRGQTAQARAMARQATTPGPTAADVAALQAKLGYTAP